MVKSLVISFVKKYLIKEINGLLEKYKDDVSKICEVIHVWTTRLAIIIDELKLISSRCSDGKIDDSEVKDSIKEIEKIVKDW